MMQAALAFANENQPAGRPLLRLVPSLPGLSAGERQAVEIGRDDAFRPGWDAGIARPVWKRRLAALLGRATGLTVTSLADPRLEKLRLFAGMMRRDDRRLHETAEGLLADGLSHAALHEAIRIALG